MLVLTRRVGETIAIGEDVGIIVLSREGGQVKIGIEAPLSVKVLRTELMKEPTTAVQTLRERFDQLRARALTYHAGARGADE